MKTLRCMIVDDEPRAVKLIENYIECTEGLELVCSFNHPTKALEALDTTPVDIIFLDIQMPDLDGMQFSHMVLQTTKIIFTTTYSQYALDSYEVSAVDYLLKSIRYQKFLQAVYKACHWFEAGANSITHHSIALPISPPVSSLISPRVCAASGSPTSSWSLT